MGNFPLILWVAHGVHFKELWICQVTYTGAYYILIALPNYNNNVPNKDKELNNVHYTERNAVLSSYLLFYCSFDSVITRLSGFLPDPHPSVFSEQEVKGVPMWAGPTSGRDRNIENFYHRALWPKFHILRGGIMFIEQKHYMNVRSCTDNTISYHRNTFIACLCFPKKENVAFILQFPVPYTFSNSFPQIFDIISLNR